MRIYIWVPMLAAGFVLGGAPSHAQVYVTSVTAAVPDSAGKVPGFNKVPGSAITNWANGVAQVILVHGASYNYCVSMGSYKAAGTAGVTYTIARKSTVIQTNVIIPPGGLAVAAQSVYYVCSGYTALPSSPGAATLTGTVSYTPTGGSKAKVSKLTTNVVLK